MARTGLGGAVLYVKDLQKLSRFYEEICELPHIESGDEHVVLGVEGGELVLVSTPASRDVTLGEPPTRRADTAIKLVFFVPDLAAARTKMRALGGLPDPIESQWSFRGFAVADGLDPEGNVIQLRAPPS